MLLTIVPRQPTPMPRIAGCCIPGIQNGEPEAAQWLYFMYAGQVRTYLRWHAAVAEVEDAVFSILLEATRAIRAMEAPSLEALSEIVGELSEQGVLALRRAQGLAQTDVAEEADRQLVGHFLSTLETNERDAVLRCSVLAETDDEISSKLKIPIKQIRKARAKARVEFRIGAIA